MKNILKIHVEFGDCDPSGIGFHPNFFRWFDAGSRHFFRAAGVPLWRDLQKINGIIGTPIVSTSCDFMLPCHYGDDIEVHTSIEEWRDKSFVMRHELRRGDAQLALAKGVRIFAIRHPEHADRIKAVPAPAEIRAACDAEGVTYG